MNTRKCILILIALLVCLEPLYSQQADSTKNKEKKLRDNSSVRSLQKEIELTIRNVDITYFPEIKIIVEANNILGDPLDTLYADNLFVMENGVEKKVISVEKISVKERVPVDFVFIIDKTGTMQKYMDDVRRNISNFTNSLVRRGIDYQIGLVVFDDHVERNYGLTDNVLNFMNWLEKIKAKGGMDTKENALEAIQEALAVKYRPSANKVGVLITDAPYHQYGDKNGGGVTDQTTKSIIKLCNQQDLRLFAIAPPRLSEYGQIAKATRGKSYDIDYPFSTILDNFSNQLTNIYALKYRTDQPAIPDSINIALLNEKKRELVRKVIPIVELGRKLIIENLLYKTGSSQLPDDIPELEVLTEFMLNRKKVVIMVEGHTDAIGSDALNNRLSLKRANSVKNYLIRKGIASRRIKTKGYGESRPIASNRTQFGRRLNRRTEIVIISK